MLGLILEGIVFFIFHILFEVFFIGTGELLLYIVTLGRRKPVWKRHHNGSSAKLAILIDCSFITGFIFWLSLAWFVSNKILT